MNLENNGAAQMPRDNLPALTGLRGVGAVWVVLFHTWIGRHQLVTSGYLGVDLFFILSGFILAHVYADRFTAPGAYRRFLRARVARIYPLHIIMLMSLAALVIAMPSFQLRFAPSEFRFTAAGFVACVFLVQDWLPRLEQTWNAPAWSLSAEWLVYLLFPIFIFTTQRWRSAVVALCLAGGSLLAFILALKFHGSPDGNVVGPQGLPRTVTEFACGCLIYRALQTGLGRLPIALDILALAGLALALATGVLLPVLFILALVILLAAQGKGLIARILSLPLFHWLGEISYSLYLTHWIVLVFWNRAAKDPILPAWQTVLWVLTGYAFILVLAWMVYRGIELPLRSWSRRIGVERAAILGNADAI